jgi:2,4-dienoyl-CoA reductase-like NADH-dependent reductase (Old Yellow Enzyme family)
MYPVLSAQQEVPTMNDVPASAASAFTPLQIGPLTIRNRFIKSATNEGRAKGGVPSKSLVSFHEGIAAGGVGMTTLAYCAVSRDGRTLDDQIILDAATVPHLRVLTEAVHRQGAAASAQITHGGCFTFVNDITTGSPYSSSGGFNKVGIMSGKWSRRRMEEEDMELVAEEFAKAALLAQDAGFDAVEIHMGHGYLLSQFLSPIYNKRRDAYGGSPAARARFPAMVLRRVLDAVGRKLAVVCKMNATDGVRSGNSSDDSAAIAQVLEREGAHLLVLSAGMNVESITTMFGSSFPKENRIKMRNPLIAAAMAIQRLTEPSNVQFREMYLLEHSRKIRAATRMPLAYLGGVKSIDNVGQAMAAGFDAVALGRALIFDAGLVEGLQSGKVRQSQCTACNRCVSMMYTPGGTSCVLGTPGDAALNSVAAAS